MKAVFLDMDGTLLNSEHSVSERSADVLSRVVSKGNRIVFASGRAYDGMQKPLSEIAFTPIMATLNGAYIIDERRDVIASFPLSGEEASAASLLIRRLGLTYLFFYGEHWGAENDGYYYQNEYSIVKIPGLISDIEKLAAETDIHKIIAAGEPDAVKRALPLLRSGLPSLSVMCSSPNYIEINRGSVDKGLALEKTAEYLGIGLEDTIAFGDYDNDIPMLERAGLGFAMANSSDNVLKMALHRTASNDQDGVAVMLEKLFSI